MRRYAITSRTLFPGPSPSAPVPHPSQLTGVPGERICSLGWQSEGWGPQLSAQCSALIRQTARWAADGIDYIQLREKDLPAASLAALARHIMEAVRDTPTKLLINSRADIAVAIGAHGVHLASNPGQLTPAQVRELYGIVGLPRPLVSISCHTLAEVAQARRSGADIVLFGPVLEKSVAGRLITSGQGLNTLQEACAVAAPAAAFALGGVTYENAPDCLAAGAAGIAGIRLFHDL